MCPRERETANRQNWVKLFFMASRSGTSQWAYCLCVSLFHCVPVSIANLAIAIHAIAALCVWVSLQLHDSKASSSVEIIKIAFFGNLFFLSTIEKIPPKSSIHLKKPRANTFFQNQSRLLSFRELFSNGSKQSFKGQTTFGARIEADGSLYDFFYDSDTYCKRTVCSHCSQGLAQISAT